MTAIEIVLIVIGVTMMIASFFITEKLSSSEINKMAELSTEEIRRILDRSMEEAERKVDEMIEGVIDQCIDQSTERVERALDKEANEKIQAINEYSDTVLESINKTHNEVMFLYSMLNDKHTELTNYAGKMAQLGIKLEELQESIEQTMAEAEGTLSRVEEAKKAAAPQQNPRTETKMEPEAEKKEQKNNSSQRQQVLALYREGKSEVDIARKLGMGVGEVKLVIGLFREGEK